MTDIHIVIIYFPQLSYLAASSAEIGGFFKLSSIEAATSGWMTFPIGLKPIPAPANQLKIMNKLNLYNNLKVFYFLTKIGNKN